MSRLHGKECRERIRAALMCDDAGKQRLRKAEKRLAPAASAARAEAAQEGQASLARVELAPKNRDEETSEACVTNNAENVKPRVEILREDSTEAISRMEDGNTPVRGPLVSAEVSSRSEGVPTVEKARIREKRSSWRLDVGVYGWVGNVHQQWKGSRICFCEIWQFSRWHWLRARHRSGLCDRWNERQRGPAEVVCDGAASLVRRRTTVCGNKSCSGPGGPRGDNETSASCEQCEGSVCCERRGRGRQEPDGWREISVVDWVSSVPDIPRSGHDDDAECKQSKRSQVEELRGAMCGKSVGKCVGVLLLHENLWNRWSRGLSFAKKMAEGVGTRKTKSDLCRSQSTMCSSRTGSCLKSKSGYVIEELGICCCNKEKRTMIHVKNVMMMVFRGLSYVALTDSESTIGSKEVGRAVEESNVMDSISVVVFDTRLMQESRLLEIDFVNQLDVYCRRPRQWESFVGMLEAKQHEYRSRLCEKELKRLGFDVECAMLGASPRKIRSMDASGARRMAGTVSGVAIEPQPGEQVVCQDLLDWRIVGFVV